ncbi:MAG: UDP-2,4-diacetamido-2,4,6-trideoxy-beta-L-altropyranose hydrolase [Butyrivibrio sp.]|nr:UDP-2,4-diacetamido-2,4,6-trideoxy-beta-L-altropyranose hydrolase [Butyrivibrio sp.]
MKKIWIEANGNGIIATGHIRRCMTIAAELIERGAEVKFLLSDEESADVLAELSDQEKKIYDCIILHTNYSEPAEDLPVLEGLLTDEKPDMFLLDSYFVTPEYMEALKELFGRLSPDTRTCYIDDLYKFDYPVDMIINYDVVVPRDFYSAETQLLGAKYAPLRKQFSEAQYEVREQAQRAFLSAGGTDPYHVLGNILYEVYEEDSPCRKVLDTTGIKCEVIVGALFEEDYKQELRDIAKRHSDYIFLHESVENMASVMEKCDFAVSAGGTTIYELCAIGVPTVVFSMADSQVDFVKSFNDAGAVRYAGDARKDHRLVQKIVTWGTASVDSQGFRRRMSNKAKELVDGKGTQKIADAIMGLIS